MHEHRVYTLRTITNAASSSSELIATSSQPNTVN